MSDHFDYAFGVFLALVLVLILGLGLHDSVKQTQAREAAFERYARWCVRKGRTPVVLSREQWLCVDSAVQGS